MNGVSISLLYTFLFAFSVENINANSILLRKIEKKCLQKIGKFSRLDRKVWREGLANMQDIEIPNKISKWGSGSSELVISKNVFFNRSIKNIFLYLGKTHVLLPNDLFHGHFFEGTQNYGILFHAKEFPYDVMETKASSLSDLDVRIRTQLNVKIFNSNHPLVKKRNIFWMANTGLLYTYNRDEACEEIETKLYEKSQWSGNPIKAFKVVSIDLDLFEDIKEIGSVNYFSEMGSLTLSHYFGIPIQGQWLFYSLY